MNYVREEGTQALTTSHEWIRTTLPDTFENSMGVRYNWKFNNSRNPSNVFPKINEILYKGSGGNYLSNEIFFRVARLREENQDKNGEEGQLPTGHFHIAKIQDIGHNMKKSEMKKLMDIVIFTINEGLKGI